MTTTYDSALTTDRDRARFLLGDTDVRSALVQDEEIDGALAMFGTLYYAAAGIADALAGKFSTVTRISIDGLSVDGAAKAENYRKLAASLRRQAVEGASGGLGLPFVAGVSKGEQQMVDDDPDREPSRVKVGMHDFPGTEPGTPTRDVQVP